MKQLGIIASVFAIISAIPVAGHAVPGFRPKQRLPGKRIHADGMSVVIPSGWTTRWAQQNGTTALVVAPGAAGQGATFVMRHPLPAAQRSAPVEQLLAAEVRGLIGQVPVTLAVEPQAMRVGNHRAGRLIANAAVDGRQLELYAAAVVVEGWAFVFVGLYSPSSASTFRPAMETMFSSLRGTPPRRNHALERRLARCWRHYTFSRSGSGSGSDTTTFRLGADGTYSYHFYMTITAGMMATRERRERGTWHVAGNQLVTMPARGNPTTYTIRPKGALLYLNGTKYLPCR